ncbi:MAG: hypothetical protein LBF01_04845 [Bacteroidales bacterium]|jgi:hypothetical protein|nr:hypothetical protein [Bacteroidales bacterium]
MLLQQTFVSHSNEVRKYDLFVDVITVVAFVSHGNEAQKYLSADVVTVAIFLSRSNEAQKRTFLQKL